MTGPRVDGLSPYQEFLYRQWGRIKARGGTDQDWANYVQHAERLPLRNVLNTPKDPDLGTPTPGVISGTLMSAFQGLSFGWGDEAIGGLAGLATLATGGGLERAEQRRQQTTAGFREQRTAFRQARPKTAIAGEIAGAIPSAGAAAARLGVRVAPSVGRAALAAAGTGAAAGALAGAGETDGPISDRTRGALFGGIVGLVLAPLTTVGIAGLAGAGKRVIPLVARWNTALGEQSGVPQTRARELLARALAQDGITVAEATKRLSQARAQGVPVTLADIAGEQTMGLAVAAQGIRGEAKRQLTDELLSRQADQGSRMLGNLADRVFRGTRGGLKNAYDTADDLFAQRSAQAAPLYDDAYQQMVQLTPTLRQMLQHPRFQDAYLVGRQIANDEDLAGIGRGLAVPELFQKGVLRPGEATQRVAPKGLAVTGARRTPPDPTAQTRSFQVGGETATGMPDQLPVRAIDYMKRGLDVIIGRGSEEGRPAIDHQLARSLNQLLRQGLAEVDEQVPSYAAARATWAGETDALNAVAMGKGGSRLFWGQETTTPRFTRKPPDIIAREMAALSPEDQALYRVGAFQDLAEAIHTQTGETPNVARQFFGGRTHGTLERSMEQRIRALFADPGAAQDFMDAVHTEARVAMNTARQVTPTRGVTEPSELVPGRTVMRRQVGTTLVGLAQSGINRARAGWTEEISDEVASLFTKGLKGPQELQALLVSLQGYERALPRQATRRAVTSVVAGQQAGTQQIP